MIDDHDVREMLQRRADKVSATPADTPTAVRRAKRRLVLNGAVATLAAAAIAVATFAGIDAIRSAPVPADPPSEELGIFAPVGGRIVYVNATEVGYYDLGYHDLGYADGLWAVDPDAPSDTVEGPSVADDVASTLVRLGPGDMIPLGWSSDGTELLLSRPTGGPLPNQTLFILHADGSETRLNEDPMGIESATISPDGTRVVFAGQYDDLSGLYVMDAEGGRPVPLPIRDARQPTFSPDGSQIAYLAGDRRTAVWVADTDGTDAHEITADLGVTGGENLLEWSPAGDRIAIQGSTVSGNAAIYTIAPDGSDLTQVVTGADSPYWSPDGSQIAYNIRCDDYRLDSCGAGTSRGGLAIADADGSNVRAFGFAASGPWHPVGSAQADEPPPTPGESFPRVDSEVLSFTGVPRLALGDRGVPGDLVAVNPETSEERLLVADIDSIHSASWSPDGRWVAYETGGRGEPDSELWVAGESQEPRLVATGGTDLFPELGLHWMWSPTGAKLATIGRQRLSTINLATGETTDLGKIEADLLSPIWSWSPDGTRLVFAAPDGSLVTVDVRKGERSLLSRLPDGWPAPRDWLYLL